VSTRWDALLGKPSLLQPLPRVFIAVSNLPLSQGKVADAQAKEAVHAVVPFLLGGRIARAERLSLEATIPR
jgi:hypothetical protein